MKKSYDKKSGKLLPYIFALLFISGVAIGTIIALWTEKDLVFEPGSLGRMSVFINSFKAFIKPCLVIWLAGFTGISTYISSVTLAYRGGIFGFVVCMFFKVYGLSGGIFKALCASLPQNILYFPFLLLLSVTAVSKRKTADYLIMLVLSALVCTVSAFIDTFVTSALISFTF